ncbi:OLC1v1018147C1 [Oldenlandia corymbosa var. corymbosa]|uniref:OLC1v1018147C1 n=1 Tax=Oldenlandia corymbosa var. corymbosa TaxID=529605 RepID=A0AAV1EB58_OLDCO|nr:OLC1v1018147C1 [Oldenlandia corymbosa var. corymbosa]
MNRALIFSFSLWQLLILLPLLHQTCCRNPVASAAGGKWDMLVPNTGIPAMHMQLLRYDKVAILDQTTFGPSSNLSLPDGKCVNGTAGKDCTAHSVEYDVLKNTVRPLTVSTDVWCSSGSVMPDGTFYHTGGDGGGGSVVRVLKPCNSGGLCDWKEISNGLLAPRWYASNHVLPDKRQIIIGGRGQFNYEFYPKTSKTKKLFDLPFLSQTNDPGAENNLYPLVVQNVDGNLFIFANNKAILFNYNTGAVIKTYPAIPDGNPRSYPSTGSGLLLPLKNLQGNIQAEVLVCGGAPKGAYESAINGVLMGALKTCGRISINDPNPKWVMETMPLARVMGDMKLLPDGNVLLINGAGSGTAGWELGKDPVLSPVLYKPDAPLGARFEVQTPAASRPRMYHSTAILLRDGRVLVGGSSSHGGYVYTGVDYPTDLSLEAFSPSYLDPQFDPIRPQITSPKSQSGIQYKKSFPIQFTVKGTVNPNLVKVTLVSPSFTTHSMSMNHRLLVLSVTKGVKSLGKSKYEITVAAPATTNLALPGYYMLFVVHQDIPSAGIWVRLPQ